MTIDLSYRRDVRLLTERTREFIRDWVLPLDDAHDGDITAAGGDFLRIKLQQQALEAGVFAPHVPVEHGGHGLGMCNRAPVFEEVIPCSGPPP
ncbi:acyl-CoA dehydrogenase family protein [Streptomyces sp. NPDC101166]|uniref:acyl-CoA dehydrogenase family protein n=1 Tax=Streptomyces sp. NPDC101166 TaxID=3366120 RepID=UPI00381161D6